MPTPIPSTLPLALGIIEILFGIAALALPPARGGPLRMPLSAFAIQGAVFVTAGVGALIVHVYRYYVSRLTRIGLTALMGLPALLAGLATMRSGMPTASLGFLVLFGASLPAVWDPDLPRVRGVAVFPLVAMIAVLEITLAVAFLFAPQVFRGPLYYSMLQYRIPIGLSLLLAGSLLVTTVSASARTRTLVHVGAAAPLLMLAAGHVPFEAWWPLLLLYPVLAALLIAHPWLSAALAERHRVTPDRAGASFEEIMEAIVWAVILLVTLAALTIHARGDRLAVYALALAASIFTLVWFRLPPPPRPRLRTAQGLAVYSAFAALIVHFSGGVQSPLGFLMYLSILAAAWSMHPRFIVIPAAIGLSSLGAGLIMAYRQHGTLGGLSFQAMSGASGLLFVSIFAYYLARRAGHDRALLRREKSELETILASMGEGLIVLDDAGRIKVYNRAAERMFGFRHADVTGRPLMELLRFRREEGADLADDSGPVADALTGGLASRQRVLVGRRETPEAVPATLTVTPFSGTEGGLLGVICTFQDIRHEVEMERMREDFFNIATHEIRTPLTVIQGNVEMILEEALGELPAAIRHVLTEVHQANARLMRLVNEFLEAARLDHGTLSFHLDTGRLPPLVQQVVDTLGSDARRKGLALTYVEPAHRLPLVRMDAEKTLQVLLNLVGNSIKYTDEGEIRIWHEARDGVVETHVRDTGVGIPEDQRSRLFERFSQVERGLRRKTGGSGLGLYIARKLAERMNGSVYLKETAIGTGSTFVFVLPAAAQAGAPVPVGASAPETETR